MLYLKRDETSVMTRQSECDTVTLDTKVLLDFLGTGDRFLVTVVPDGDIGTGLCKAASNSKTDASASARDDGCFAFQGKERHDPGLLGSKSIVVVK